MMTNNVYELREDVRVFFNNENEIRFRKGIWNYIEAIVNLHGQTETIKEYFSRLARSFIADNAVDIDAVAKEVGLSSEETTSAIEMFQSIKDQGYLYTKQESDIKKTLMAILGGTYSGLEKYAVGTKPVLLVSDNKDAIETARNIAKKIKLPLDVLDPEVLDSLQQMDLTNKLEAIEYLKDFERMEKYFSNYSCVVGAILSPNVTLLRNINRILIKQEKPLVLGIVDGPFVSITSSIATQTGCFECYEHRLLARLEDTHVYHKFVEETKSQNKEIGESEVFSPITHILTAAILTEAFLYSTLSMFKLSGRIVNIYLPLFEIQVQDLLRVPYCPACGHISKNQMNEMYISAKNVVDRMLDTIEIS